jgi:hypothetical protein
LILAKNGSGKNLGDFLTNSSCHPVLCICKCASAKQSFAALQTWYMCKQQVTIVSSYLWAGYIYCRP